MVDLRRAITLKSKAECALRRKKQAATAPGSNLSGLWEVHVLVMRCGFGISVHKRVLAETDRPSEENAMVGARRTARLEIE